MGAGNDCLWARRIAVERRPAHHAREQELAGTAACLPDALVRSTPVLGDPIEQAPQVHPEVVRDRLTVLVIEVDRVQQLPVDVELELVVRPVPDPHRARSPVALEVLERRLGQLVPSVDAVHDLERAVRAQLRAARLDPAHERGGLVREAETHQAVEGERPVADPAVPVIPVALAPDVFGKPERRRGDDGPMLARREQLQRQRGAVDHLAPAAGVARAGDPAPPEGDGPVETSVGIAR